MKLIPNFNYCGNWIPVNKDSLPDPGVPVLVHSIIDNKSHVLRAMYSDGNPHHLSDPFQQGCTSPTESGWYELNNFDNTHSRISGNILYWTFLPVPPAKDWEINHLVRNKLKEVIYE